MKAADATDFAITIGSYELLEGVGSDAVSELWIARESGQPDRVLRLVRLKADALGDSESREAFLAFMRKAASRRSPLLLRVLAVGSEGDNVYAVLEHVEGVNLGGLLSISHDAGEKLPVGIVLRIVLDVVAALDALRSPHGDLGPDEIHITAGGVTLLSPVSLAVAACRAPREGALRRLAYKAPEQLAGQQIGGSARADVFALGAILYEGLTGSPLLAGTDGDAIAGEMATALPPETDDLPAQLAKVLQRALARDPAKRYADPADFGQALEKAAPELVADRHQIASVFWHLAGNDIAARRFELESLLRGATEVAIEEARRSSEFPPARPAEEAVATEAETAEAAAAEEAGPEHEQPEEPAAAGQTHPDQNEADEAGAEAEVAEAGREEAAAEENAEAAGGRTEDDEHAAVERDEPSMAHQRSIPPERAAHTRRVVTGVVLGAAALLALGLIVRKGHRAQLPSATPTTAATHTSPPAKTLPAPPPAATQPAVPPSAAAVEPPAPTPAAADSASAAAPTAKPEHTAQVAAPPHHKHKHKHHAHAAAAAPAKAAAPPPAPAATSVPAKHVASFGALPASKPAPKPKPTGGPPVKTAPF